MLKPLDKKTLHLQQISELANIVSCYQIKRPIQKNKIEILSEVVSLHMKEN